jgi:H+/Cl- antiporter ClcA
MTNALLTGAVVYTPELLNMAAVNYPYQKWELAMFLAMGIFFGYLSRLYVLVNRQVRCRHFRRQLHETNCCRRVSLVILAAKAV